MSILNFKNPHRLELIKLERIFSNRTDGIVLLRLYEQKGDLLLPLTATLVDQNCLFELEKRFDLSLLTITQAFIDSGRIIQTVFVGDSSEGRSKVVILEWIKPKISLIVFGAGHIGHCVATLGLGLGYRVTVIDDRSDFVSRSRFPDERVHLVVGQFDSVISRLSIDRNSVVVIATRGHQHDEVCLQALAQRDARYIGMIGSKRRVKAILGKLLEAGVSQARLAKIHAPIGLAIGAKTPQEIGIAIIAEIIACLNKREDSASVSP